MIPIRIIYAMPLFNLAELIGVWKQTKCGITIEPVFEADFRDCSYGFRPKRSAKQALEVVRKACNNKGYYVVDADIEKFFDNVNQDKLMKLVEQRISDRRILKLIRQWLVSGVLYGNVLTISELGTSQGVVRQIKRCFVRQIISC